jgi:hypothetical protein
MEMGKRQGAMGDGPDRVCVASSPEPRAAGLERSDS